MPRITVLDPTAPPPEDVADAGPDVISVTGKTVGIRLDRAWKSFEWVADEWTRSFAELGAKVTRWVAGNRVGDEGERTRQELEGFTAGVDLAIVGLGN